MTVKSKLEPLRDDKNNLEERLIALLLYKVDKEQEKDYNIYDVAWGLLALRNIGKFNERLYDEVCQITSRLKRMSFEDLSDFLYDYRRAVGVALSIYLVGAKGLELSKRLLHELCEILVMNSKSSKIGELVGATFLVLRHFGNKEMEKEIKNLMFQIKELTVKDPAFHLTDLMYLAFFSAIADDRFYKEILELIHANRHLLAYIEDDPEKLALFLYLVSKATDSKDYPLTEWCKDQRERVAHILKRFSVRDYLALSSHLSLMDVLVEVAQGVKGHSIVKEVRGDEAVIDLRKVSLLLPRPDLISKIIIALYEAGHLRPFALSKKKEVDAYRQIRAELSSYRRVRKYELVFILTTSGLFMSLLPLVIIGLSNITMDMIQIISSLWYYYVVLVIPIIIFIQCIWKSGHISIQELKRIIYVTIERLMNR